MVPDIALFPPFLCARRLLFGAANFARENDVSKFLRQSDDEIIEHLPLTVWCRHVDGKNGTIGFTAFIPIKSR